MQFSRDDLQSIRNKIDIVQFLEERGITLRQSGTSMMGLCPIHNERTPSFHVKPFNQTFRCYGCGVNGDIFSLVQELENLSFPGAVQYLADLTGVKISGGEEDPEYVKKQRLFNITQIASEWFRFNYKKLDETHPAKQELARRNLLEYSLNDETVGFAPANGLYPILSGKGFSDEELVNSGVFLKTEGGGLRERFRNRLTWTMCTPQGKPTGFSARKIFENDTGPKYINSPQTEIFNKSKTLLGIENARRAITNSQKVYIVEGQTDVMALKASGLPETVATCGTAFGLEHANMLLHLSKLGKHAEHFELIFCFDGDTAGIKAARSVFEKLPQIHLNAYVVKFVDNGTPTDPCDYRVTHGDLALASFINSNRVPLIEFVLSESRFSWDLTTPEGKSNYVNEAKKYLSQITDRIQYAAYVRKVAAWTGLSYTDLTSEMKIVSKPTVMNDSQPVVEVPTVLENIPEFMIPPLATITQYPDEAKQVIEKYDLNETYFGNEAKVAEKLLKTLYSGEIDYNDKIYINLSHTDLNITSGRELAAVDNIFKTFLRTQYLTESSKLDVLLFDSPPDPVKAFEKIVEQQKQLKEKFRQ